MRSMIFVACAGCQMAPPPPIIPMHTDTAADPSGETTVMIVVGLATQVFNEGLGLALRVEHQQTERTALGVEIAAGRGDADDRKLYMLAVRGYGRGTPRSRDWVAVTYGVGVSALDTGMLTLSAFGGGAVSHPNESLEPYLHLGAAVALPIRQGITFGDASKGTSARTTLYLYGDVGLVLPIGESNQLSLALSGALGFGGPAFGAITAADAVPL